MPDTARRVKRVLARSKERFAANNPKGLTEADVLRLVKEHRAEKRAKSKRRSR